VSSNLAAPTIQAHEKQRNFSRESFQKFRKNHLRNVSGTEAKSKGESMRRTSKRA
jgi:hypothetical protein